MNRCFLFLLLLAIPGNAWAERYVVETGSKIIFIANHPTHEIRGESIRASGELVYDPANPTDFSGIAGRPIQAPWLSFNSGNANRDSNMRLAVNAQAYPNVTFVPTEVTGASVDGDKVTGTVLGRLYINGVRRDIKAPLSLDLSNPAELKVHSEFSITMTEFNIERPSLLFVKTDDDVRIAVDLILVPSRQ